MVPLRRSLPLWLAFACNGPADTDTDPDPARDPYDVVIGPYDVEIRTTSWGVPHLRASDDGSSGFGLGYVAARDHICVIADQILKTRSERAKYFGPGPDDVHVDSDFGWLHLGVRSGAEATFLDLPERGQARLVGYAAGYNRFLAEVGVDGLPPDCRGAAWVKPIDHIDLLAYYYSMGMWGSAYNFVTLVGQAQPPGTDSQGGVVPRLAPPPLEFLAPVKEPPIGSNGWAIGSDLSETGGGALLSNTHFPMFGERQWHEFHLTVPGELDVYGVGLVGLPLVAMGFNEHIAWTHTVSNTPRFKPYLLKLRPGDATSYEVDGEFIDMESQTYTIEVLGDGGATTSRERTLYRTRFGPIWNAPVVGWGIQAMAFRDVNALNTGLLETFDGMNRATDLATFEAAHREHQGIPWVHTIATDRAGTALYMDSAATPNVSEDVWARYDQLAEDNFFVKQFAGFGLVVFDGSTTAYDWTDDPRAARPGTVPHDEVPRLQRTDYVLNANDNYWLANASSPMSGYPRIYGRSGTTPSARTRMNHLYVTGQVQDPERGSDGKWSLDEIEAAALSMRSLGAELLREGVVARCTGAGPVEVVFGGSPQTVDIGPACDVLAAWDGRGRTDSVGAHVWRELVHSGPITGGELRAAGKLFAVPFDPARPLETPRDLAPRPREGGDPVLEALAVATLRLADAGVAVDAALGDVQFRKKGSTTSPVAGGDYLEGYIGIATWSGNGGNTTLLPKVGRGRVINAASGLTDEGYVVSNGNSFVMALQFDQDGPKARAHLVYSQSEDPASPHFADQGPALEAEGVMRPILFREAEIAADPNLRTERLTLE
jgi:acyl-homoserine-lactone acylase